MVLTLSLRIIVIVRNETVQIELLPMLTPDGNVKQKQSLTNVDLHLQDVGWVQLIHAIT